MLMVFFWLDFPCSNNEALVHTHCITTTEAVAIRLRDSVLCHQKRFVQPLPLPWPSETERVIQTGMLVVQIPHINIDNIDPPPTLD